MAGFWFDTNLLSYISDLREQKLVDSTFLRSLSALLQLTHISQEDLMLLPGTLIFMGAIRGQLYMA